MKFNEKLIVLRKKGGLSQEDLAYKFNVTRQTISKWELGQTTPEMDKLVEMSKFFNVSVDELINDTETNVEDTTNTINDNTTTENVVIEDKTIEEKNTKNRRTIIIVIIVVAIILLLGFGVTSAVNKTVDSIFDSVIGSTEEYENQKDGIFAIFNKIFDLVDEQMEETDANIKKHEVTMFNLSLTGYQGTNRATEVKELIDKIVTKNKTEDKKITILFDEKTLTKSDEMIAMKKQIVSGKEYEVDIQYDEEGYIYQINVEEVEETVKEEKDSSNDVKEQVDQMKDDFEKIEENSDKLFEEIFNQMN